MTKILIVAEHSGGKLNPATAKCVACASKIDGAQIDIAVFSTDGSAVAAEAAKIQGVKTVLKVDQPGTTGGSARPGDHSYSLRNLPTKPVV